jgi:hypothetical protein
VVILEVGGSHKLFALAGLKPRSFSFQPRISVARIIGMSHWHSAN